VVVTTAGIINEARSNFVSLGEKIDCGCSWHDEEKRPTISKREKIHPRGIY